MNRSVFVQPHMPLKVEEFSQNWQQQVQHWLPDVSPAILATACIALTMFATFCKCCPTLRGTEAVPNKSARKATAVRQTEEITATKADAQVETALNMSTVTTLENLDGILNAYQSKPCLVCEKNWLRC